MWSQRVWSVSAVVIMSVPPFQISRGRTSTVTMIVTTAATSPAPAIPRLGTRARWRGTGR